MPALPLAEILKMHSTPKRMERHLLALISDGTAAERTAANNALAVHYWHHNDLQSAISTFKQTIHLEPLGMEAIWAMRLLSTLYQRLGFKSERYQIDLQRIMSLRRILHFSDEDENIRFAANELKREWDDRDLVAS